MRKQLPPPANWQDFEDLCRALFAAEWGDPETEKNGRPGQKQNGVDIVGQREGRYWAAQRKLRRIYPETQLTSAEVRDEVEAAKSFDVELETLVIATTAPADTKIQRLAREISTEHENSDAFRVVIWDWEKICIRLAEHPVGKTLRKLSPAITTIYAELYEELGVDLRATLEEASKRLRERPLSERIDGLELRLD